MKDKVLATIARYALIAQGDHIVVGFSGGADSIALLHFLWEMRHQLGITVSAAHLNHGLRGDEADRDEAFAREVCAQWDIELAVERAYMNERPWPQGKGTEEWARELRYAFFEELHKKQGGKIALAHTLSDNAETVLFHIARGTGPRGLGGIPPSRECYIRPLIQVNRTEIEEYCAQNKLSYSVDSTNYDCVYARNRIRRKILPELEQVHSGATAAIGRLAEDMAEMDSWLSALADEWLEKAKVPTGFSVKVLWQVPKPVRLYIYTKIAGRGTSRLTLERIDDVLWSKRAAEQLDEKRRIVVYKTVLRLEEVTEGCLPFAPQTFAVGEYFFEDGKHLLAEAVSLEKWQKMQDSLVKKEEKGLTFAADYDKIPECAVVRTRNEGDLFAPQGRKLTKKLKKWMNEQAILPNERLHLPLLAVEDKVLWVWGFGFAEGLAVTAQTTNVLLLHCN